MQWTLRGVDRPFLSILLLALGVRLVGIASRPIWYDEAFSILFSRKGPSAMIYGTLASTGTGASDIHPLGYYTLLWLWMKVFGESIPAVRMLSILAGLGIVGTVYLISSALFDRNTALAATTFAAMAPFQIHYSQEIRMYGFLGLWLLLATYACVRGMQSSRIAWWAVFAVCSALAQYTHNLAAFYLVCLALTPALKKDWRALRSAALAALVALLLYLPWLIQLPAQLAKIQQAYWIERPEPYRLFTLLMTFVTNLPIPTGWLAPALFIGLSVVTLGVVQTALAFHQDDPGARAGLWGLYLSFAPPLLLFIVSQWGPLYLERALLPSGAAFCIWLAWALTRPAAPRLVRNAALCLLLAASLIGLLEHVTYRGFPYGPYAALADSLRSRLQPGDMVLHSNKLTFLPSLYYDGRLSQAFLGDPPGSATDTLAPATQAVLGVKAAEIGPASAGAPRIFFVIFEQSLVEYGEAGKGPPPDLGFLNANFSLASEESWDDLRVYLFVRQP